MVFYESVISSATYDIAVQLLSSTTTKTVKISKGCLTAAVQKYYSSSRYSCDVHDGFPAPTRFSAVCGEP